MKNTQSHSPFDTGKLIDKKSTPKAFFKENNARLLELNKRVKLFRGYDGWFADGKSGQLWEHGKHKLGFTVGNSKMISAALNAGFRAIQRGDDEANFSCDWTDSNVRRLIKLLKLRTRRESPTVA